MFRRDAACWCCQLQLLLAVVTRAATVTTLAAMQGQRQAAGMAGMNMDAGADALVDANTMNGAVIEAGTDSATDSMVIRVGTTYVSVTPTN